MVGIGSIWLRIGTSGGTLVNAVMNFGGSIKRWEVLEWLYNWQLLKNGSTP
jgi:hypothetical protein